MQVTQQHRHYRHKRRRPLAAGILAVATVAVLGISPHSSHAFFSVATSTSLKLQHSKIFGDDCIFYQSAGPCNSLSALFAKARRSGGAGGGSGATKKSLNRKKKAQSDSRKGALLKSKKSKKGDGKSKKAAPAVSTAVSSASSISSSSASSGQRAPPWQVLSQKDAKKNIQREKKRREAISKGEAATSVTSAQLFQDIDEEDDFETPMQVSTSFMNPAEKAFSGWKRFNPSTVSMRYVASVLDRQPLPRLGVPEIAFLGRSNVGKSSLLNRLSSFSKKEGGVTGEARVGKTPGATASVNLFGFYDKKEKPMMGFVDLPGFGYAKLSKGVKESVQQAAERYLDKRKELVLGILLVDIRRIPSDDDRAVLAALFDQGLPIVVIATKVDKVNKNDLEGQLEQIRDGLGLPDGQPFSVSSVTGEGTKALWNIIMEASEGAVEEFHMELLRGGTPDTERDEETEEEDDEDPVYDQGYDWIQNGDVVYEGNDEDYFEGDDEEEDGYMYYEDNPMDDMPVEREESLKELKKRAKKLEEEKKV